MRLSLVLLVLTLALLVASVPQRRGGRRGSSSSRRRVARPPGGSQRVMAVQAARSRAENDPTWVKCENSVEQASLAEHIVTARVEHVGASSSNVHIKRVLKGATLPARVHISTCSDTCCALRRRDTRLFLLGRPKVVDGEEVFPQVAPPLTITLKTLGRIRAAVTDVPYEPRPPIEEEPCEQQFCAWGGECVTDEEGVATCACPTTCPPPSSTTSPVCGTDGTTYPTICELRRHACRNQRETRIRHSGACDDGSSSQPEDDTFRTRAWDRASAPRDRDPNATRTPSDGN